MVLRRIGPLSAAKLGGALYVLIGLIVGAIVALMSLAGLSFAPSQQTAIPYAGVVFGVGAILVFPICYGILGFLTGLIAAAFYNVIAGMVGGVYLDLR